MPDPDVIVVGGGPAGYACALRCRDLGLSVTLLEESRLGGTCLHRGCIPTRAMLEAASIADGAVRRAERWGLLTKYDGVDMGTLHKTRDEIVGRNERAVTKHLSGSGVQVIAGRGTLLGPREVSVGADRLRANKAIVLATGSRPRRSPVSIPDGESILTSDQALALDRVPRSMLILGGGAIGAEFAQLWRALGAEVTLAEREEHLVPFEDADVGRSLSRALRRQGIAVVEGIHVEEVAVRDGLCEVVLRTPGRDRTLQVEVLVNAIGREAALDGIGLENLHMRTEDGFISPRSWATLETHEPGVYAVGDLLPTPSLGRAHVAYAEGMLVADRIAGGDGPGIFYRNVPRITHGIVETACVGLSEAEARETAEGVRAVSMPLGAVGKGAILGEPGLAKVVVDGSDTVLGVHLVGPQITELMGEATAIVDFKASPSDVAALVHPHPTLSEVLAEMHLSLAGRPLHLR